MDVEDWLITAMETTMPKRISRQPNYEFEREFDEFIESVATFVQVDDIRQKYDLTEEQREEALKVATHNMDRAREAFKRAVLSLIDSK